MFSYHKAAKETIEHYLVPGIKVGMDRELGLGYESHWTEAHHNKVKYKPFDAREPQYPSYNPGDNWQKRPAEKNIIQQVK